MANRKDDHITNVEKALFTDKVKDLNASERKMKDQIEAIFIKWDNNKFMSDKKIRQWIKTELQVTDSMQAYRLMTYAKEIRSNIKASKAEFHRHNITQICYEIIQLGMEEGDHEKVLMAVEKIGRFNKCDKTDEHEFTYDNVFIPEWKPTSDIRAIGLKKLSSEERKKLIMKYDDEIQEAELIDDDEEEDSEETTDGLD